MSQTYRTVCQSCNTLQIWTVTPRVTPKEIHDALTEILEDGGFAAEPKLAAWLEERFGIEQAKK